VDKLPPLSVDLFGSSHRSEAMIIPTSPDPVAEAIDFINVQSGVISQVMSTHLTKVIDHVAPINDIFWSDPRIGNGGKALLLKLSANIAALAMHGNEYMNETLLGAGSTLTPNDDGTVTHTPAQ
jgi:hypothetical protein